MNCARGNVRTVNIMMMLAKRTTMRAQFTFSTLEVNFEFHKLDALHLVVPTIMACVEDEGINRVKYPTYRLIANA